jgi:CheY-like chemotaxis protein
MVTPIQLAYPVLVARDMAKKILVVEDNDDCRELLARFLKSVGYEVVEAATGLQGVHLACRARPDLILMDLSLPTLAEMKQQHGLKQTRHQRHTSGHQYRLDHW